MFEHLSQTNQLTLSSASQPRFKRLLHSRSPLVRPSLPLESRSGGLDNSKQNLVYQGHLSKVRSACKLDQTTIVSRYLRTIRKDYDELNKVTRKQLSSVRIKKREIEFMRQKNLNFAEKREDLEKRINQQMEKTFIVQTREQEAKMQTKTLDHIIKRMKKDQIFYKLYGRIRDQHLKNTVKNVKMLDQNLIAQDQKFHRLLSELQACQKSYECNTEVREMKFSEFAGKISEAKGRDQFLQQRKERTYDLQSIQLNDTLDEKNIRMREIILAHRVADMLLESKVAGLIKANAQLQTAFHLVQVRTGVPEPQMLTHKFFSYQHISDDLLHSITQQQQILRQLKETNQQLKKTYHDLSEQGLLQNNQVTIVPIHALNKQKLHLHEEVNRIELLKDTLIQWISRKYLLMLGTTTNIYDVGEIFSLLCQCLQNELEQNKDFDWSQHRVPTMGVCLKKIVREATTEELSVRVRESQDMIDSNLIEQQYIRSSRHHVLKKAAFNIKQIKRDTIN